MVKLKKLPNLIAEGCGKVSDLSYNAAETNSHRPYVPRRNDCFYSGVWNWIGVVRQNSLHVGAVVLWDMLIVLGDFIAITGPLWASYELRVYLSYKQQQGHWPWCSRWCSSHCRDTVAFDAWSRNTEWEAKANNWGLVSPKLRPQWRDLEAFGWKNLVFSWILKSWGIS